MQQVQLATVTNPAYLLDVLAGMLERAIWLVALPRLHKRAAHRHAVLVILVQKAACIAPHAQAPQPVGAHRLQVSQAAKLVI